MKRYIAKRFLYSVIVIWLVMTVVFIAMRMIPGGPVVAALGTEATPESIERVRMELGLNDPLHVQYINYWIDLSQFELGNSITRGVDVTTLLSQAAPKTLSIASVGIVTGLVLSIPSGIISATRRHKPVDYIATIAAFLGLSMPAFYIGILLALVFGIWLNLLPVFGYTSLSEGVFPWLESILLPGIAVGLPYGAIVMRMMRSSLLEVLDEEYMKVARAKGIDSRVRLYKHGIQNALIPVVTVAGIQIALVIVGSVTVELVFGIQGIGRVLVNSILNQDYPVLQAVIVIVAIIMIGANFVVDMVYTVLDPRIRYGSEGS